MGGIEISSRRRECFKQLFGCFPVTLAGNMAVKLDKAARNDRGGGGVLEGEVFILIEIDGYEV